MFAAMGGNQSQGYYYSGSNNLSEVGWYYDNSGYWYLNFNPVGTLAPNELGLYDMSGNVFEWCWDIYDLYYPSGPQTDPHGPNTGQNGSAYRVIRGGYTSSQWYECSVYCRHFVDPGNINSSNTGFRCVRVIP